MEVVPLSFLVVGTELFIIKSNTFGGNLHYSTLCWLGDRRKGHFAVSWSMYLAWQI